MRSLAPLAAIHLAGNALLLWLGYYWLGLGETRAATLLWSALVALLLLSLASWLHGATFAYFAADPRRLTAAFRTSLRRLGPLVAAAIVVLAIYLLLAAWAAYSPRPAFKIASYLTLTFRKPVKPASVLAVLNAALWLIRWMVVPVVLLPILSGIATQGWRGAAPRSRKPVYWVETPVLLVCALWIPLQLMGWAPHVGGFGMEMFSFVVRLIAAYLLFVGAWLALTFLTSGGNPRVTQSSTAVSP